jgi:hypothetical protein
MVKKTTLSFFFFLLVINLAAQRILIDNDNLIVIISEKNMIKELIFKKNNQKINFLDNEFAGVSWYIQEKNGEVYNPPCYMDNDKIYAVYKSLKFVTEYQYDQGRLMIINSVTNTGNLVYQPEKIGLRLGIDPYMKSYPEWNKIYFPTMLRCEPTHFWGYFMTPEGHLLTIATKEPVASWSIDYKGQAHGIYPHLFQGHRINSVNLDVINTLPLPERHPHAMWQLFPGETKQIHLYLQAVSMLEDIPAQLSVNSAAPFIDIPRTAYEENIPIHFCIKGDNIKTIDVISPSGQSIAIQKVDKPGQINCNINHVTENGLYTIRVKNSMSKISEASFTVLKPYSWYMQKAMKAVIDYPQKASKTHCESWYGFYTAFAGGKYFPGNEYLKKALASFEEIYPLVFDTIHFEPLGNKFRIQNISAWIGILVDKYELSGKRKDLNHALGFADYILKSQSTDGVYRAESNHYTSVIYPAKSLLELMDAMKPLHDAPEIRKYYDRIYDSVKRAMDELVQSNGNIGTEGELTFEDGMISCSALQLLAFAMRQDNAAEKEKYFKAGINLLEYHECLEQLVMPDSRMRSSSLRFWEAQYDVLISNNMFNSPHGWSSWTTYANYYAYLISGDIKYLQRTFNGLGSAMQMIDSGTGRLRWAFITDPYVKVRQINRNIDGATPLHFPGTHYHADLYPHEELIIGEQYVDMVSDWFFANANDNDVHEHFKCLEEIALNKAYVAENTNGDIIFYNCIAEKKGNTLIIRPCEVMIEDIHFNLKEHYIISVQMRDKVVKKKVEKGMSWLKII